MNKKYLIGLFVLLTVGLVTAGYVVNSFTITTNVLEPFNVEYIILGNTTNITDCSTAGLVWSPSQDLLMPGIFPGESRIVCVKINNSASVELGYDVSSVVNATADKLSDCQYAFGSPTMIGNVSAQTSLINGSVMIIPTDAVAVDGCELQLSIARG